MTLDDFRSELARRGLSGREAAAVLKTSQANLSRVLRGHKTVTEESLEAAAHYLRNPEGQPPALVSTSTHPRQADYRLTLDQGQRDRLQKLSTALDQDPAEMLQDLVNVLLWPGAPSRVKSRWFRMIHAQSGS